MDAMPVMMTTDIAACVAGADKTIVQAGRGAIFD
jgi:hypothetical protein